MAVTLAEHGGGRPRVLMVVRLFAPWIGGTERQAAKLAAQLRADGTDVQIVTGRWFRGTPRCEVIDGIPLFRNHTLWECFGVKGLRKLGGYLYILTLAWHLWRRRRSYDVVHVHGLNYHALAPVVMGRLLGRPTLIKQANSGPASDILRMREGRQLALSGLALPAVLRADRFVALNTAVVAELRAAGVPAERIVEIPNGVPLPPGIVPRGTLHDPPRVLYLGRLHPQKGLDVLLRAIASLTEPVLAQIVGTGPVQQELVALAEDLGISDRVELPGATSLVAPLLEQADVFVLPSRAEGLSNALLEALAAGLPVAVSAIPGNRDVVVHEDNGLLVEPDDPEALAAALARLLRDDALRQRLGRRARQTAEERYALEAVAARYQRLYAELVEETPKEAVCA